MQQHNDDDNDFGAILAAFEAQKPADKPDRGSTRVGSRARGTVVAIGDEFVFVDLGGKAQGAILTEELRAEDGVVKACVGEEIDSLVVAVDPDSGLLQLSVKPGRTRIAAASGGGVPPEISQAHTHGVPVEGTVTEIIKGGATVMIGGVRAFCPMSQLDSRFVGDGSALVGQKFLFRVTKAEDRAGRGADVVVSRRALLEEESRRLAAETRAKLVPGAVLEGKITSLATYGAFVDLGGIEGLIHVSELAHGRVDKPEEVVAVGQSVQVKVLRTETGAAKEKGGKDKKGGGERVSLSRKALLDDPWRAFAGGLAIGARMRGTIRRLQPFGVFVELAPGVDGLLHISELATNKHVNHPKDVVEVGQAVDVAVREIDIERKRIALVLAREDGGVDGPRSSSGGGSFGTMGNFFDRSKSGG